MKTWPIHILLLITALFPTSCRFQVGDRSAVVIVNNSVAGGSYEKPDGERVTHDAFVPRGDSFFLTLRVGSTPPWREE